MHEDYATGDWVKALEYLGRGRRELRALVCTPATGVSRRSSVALLSERGELAQGLATSAEAIAYGQETGDQGCRCLGAVRRWPDPHHAGRSRKGGGAPARRRERPSRGGTARSGHLSRRRSGAVPHAAGTSRRGSGSAPATTKSASARTASRDRFSAVCAAHKPSCACWPSSGRMPQPGCSGRRSRRRPAERCAGGKADVGALVSAYRFTGTYGWLRGNPRKAESWWRKSLTAAERLGACHGVALTELEMGGKPATGSQLRGPQLPSKPWERHRA